MYGVTDEAIEAYKTDGVHKEFRIVLGNTSYENDQIVDNSLNLKQSILDNENFEAIGCIASSFSVELYAQFSTKIRDKKIKVFVKAGDSEEIQIFEGYVNKCTKTANGWKRSIEAYDILYTMSGQSGQDSDSEEQKKKYDVTEWYNNHDETTIESLFRELCTKFNLRVKDGNNSLVNGSVTTNCGKNKKATNLSALDLLKYIMQINGCFGYITGDGYFSWKYLLNDRDTDGWLYPSGYVFPDYDVYPGRDTSSNQNVIDDSGDLFIGEYYDLEYQDFKMLPINCVKIKNFDKDENGGSYGSGENTYIIRGNILVNENSKADKDLMAMRIYDMFSYVWYVPFSANTLGLPYVECGDQVSMRDFNTDPGQASKQKFFILSRTLSGGQHLVDNFSAQGNEYLHEFITGDNDDSGVREELENNYDTSDEVDEKIAAATNLAAIVSVASISDIPNPPLQGTLYCVQGEIKVVENIDGDEEPDDPEEPDPEDPEEPTEPDEPTEP